MARQALDCLRECPDGSWICFRDSNIEGLSCVVKIHRGQRFSPHAVFAGYANFTGYLASISVKVASSAADDS